MYDILKTRKTVQYYVWYNLCWAVFGLIIGFVIQFLFNPKMKLITEKIATEDDHMVLFKTLGIMFLSIVLFLFIFWLFYRLLYGILLRKLTSNYKELKKIDL